MSGGKSTNRHAILQISDTTGSVLYDFRKDGTKPVDVLSEKTTMAMNQMLSQVPEWGTGRRAKLDGIKTAGKTGTTQSYRDAWFVGYTGNFVAAVWFGNDNYEPTRRLTGGRLPAMTWKKFMTYAHQNIDLRPLPFVEPEKAQKTRKDIRFDSSKPADVPVGVVRQKPLSAETTRLLRQLEQEMRAAPRLQPLSVTHAPQHNGVAASTGRDVVTR